MNVIPIFGGDGGIGRGRNVGVRLASIFPTNSWSGFGKVLFLRFSNRHVRRLFTNARLKKLRSQLAIQFRLKIVKLLKIIHRKNST